MALIPIRTEPLRAALTRGAALALLAALPAHAQTGNVAGEVPTDDNRTLDAEEFAAEPVIEPSPELDPPDSGPIGVRLDELDFGVGEINIAPSGGGAGDDEVVVTGTLIPNEKLITSEITSVLNQEDFATIGASDIGAALTRVTGVSIAQGKFPVVRGLNERYTSVSLNGSPLPSPEPLRKVAPLDLFPTSTLDDVVVAKTFSPELFGEFGGGNIALETRAVPLESFLEVSVSGSADTETTLRRGLATNGSDTDWLGYSSDGVRALPALDAAGEVIQPTFDGTTLTRGGNVNSFDTAVLIERDNIPGGVGARVTGGLRHDFGGGMSLGVLGTVGYGNDWESRNGVDNSVFESGGALVFVDRTEERSTENEIEANAFLSVGLEVDGNNTLILTGLATRSTEIETRVNEGTSFDFDEGFRREQTEFIEREALFGQLRGLHTFESLNFAELDWRASYSVAKRDAPLERFTLFEPANQSGTFAPFAPGTDFILSDDTNSNGLNFSDLDDDNYDLGVDAVVPLELLDREVDLKFGASYIDKRRETDQLFFRYDDINAQLATLRPDVLFSDALLAVNAIPGVSTLELNRVGGVGFPELSRAEQDVTALYAGVDVELNEAIRLAGGARWEDSSQSTAVGRAFSDAPLFEFAPLDDSFLLPAATVTWTFADGWQLRAAASKTINRPQFREITPTLFVNSETDENFLGNPTLVNSEVVNLDARVERYFTSSQFLTLGGFYKDLTNPIEEINLEIGESDATGFINAPQATLWGLEAEFEKRFGLDALAFVPFLRDPSGARDLVIRSNYTFSQSDVSNNGEISAVVSSSASVEAPVTLQTFEGSQLFVDGRRLQGQSDHILNVQIGVEDSANAWEVTLLLNYQSDRTRLIDSISTTVDGRNQLLDVPIEEDVPLTLDFVANWSPEIANRPVAFGLKIANILGEDYESFRRIDAPGFDSARAVTDAYDIGTVFSGSVKVGF